MNPREILHKLEQTGEYVFHGSPDVIDILEPRQPHIFDQTIGKMVPDGSPAVVASPYCDIAIFRAIINKKNVPQNYQSGFSYDADKKLLGFKTTQSVLDQAKDKNGFVYVLDKNDFTPKIANAMDWRAGKSIKPIKAVKVSYSDLPENIQIT